MNDPRLQLRSPILHKMPDPSVGLRERLSHAAWRFAAFIVLGGQMVGLVLSVHYRVWDKDGPGRILYEFHDHVFLWLKGNIHSRFFPHILALWYCTLTLAALALASWLFEVSFTRCLHICLLRLTIFGRIHPSIQRHLVLPRVEPYLVRAVANNELEKALIELGQQQLRKAPKRPCRRVSYLTCLVLDLERKFRTNPIPYCRAVELWYHSYFLLHAYGDKDAKWFKKDMSDMLAAFDILTSTNTSARKEFTRHEHFHLSKLMVELGEIVAPIGSGGEENGLELDCVNRITDAIDTRRKLLDEVYAWLQRRLTERPSTRIRILAGGSPQFDLSLEEAASTGRIAQDIALHMALIRKESAVAQAYLDACDSVFLLTEAFHVDLNASEYRNQRHQLFAHLTGNASGPVTDPYPLLHATNVCRFVAQLGAQELSRRKAAWQFELALWDKSFMRDGDFQFEQQQHNILERLAETPPVLKRKVVPLPLVPPRAVIVEKAVRFWKRVPLWRWGIVGGLVLLTVVGGTFLMGRRPQTTPTSTAMVVRVSTTTATVAPAVTPASPTAYPTHTLYPIDTPVPTDTPVPAAEPSTEELLAEAVLPERDLSTLTTRFKNVAEPIPAVVNPTPPTYGVGDKEAFWVSNIDTDEYFQITAELRYITPHVYMWVHEGHKVDQEGLERSAERFESQTYLTNRRFFGSEWSPGVDNDVHLHILHASGLGSGFTGYFLDADEYSHLVNEFSNEKEMIYINLDESMTPGTSSYDGTLAHLFQYVIHWHTDRNEDTWVNVGCSELAAYLNGFDVGGADRIFSRSPDTQLVAWPEGSAHIGASYLFMAYFLDRFGEEALQQVVASKTNGIAAFDEVLADRGLEMTFEDVFADWLIANYLDDPSFGDGRYGYKELNPAGPSLDTTHVSYPVQRATTVHQYGADYIELQASGGDVLVEFSGSTVTRLVNNEAHSGSYQWWSNRGDEIDTTLTRAFDLTGLERVTLQAWLWYDIEEGWDYAYVAVSDDGGGTWDLLEGKNTTATNPHGNSFGHAYTGVSGSGSEPEWVWEEIDLTPYTGGQILVRFEYVTDSVYNGSGFFVDDMSIPGLDYHHDAEDGDGWEAMGFIRTNNILSQRYLVQFVEMGAETRVRRMELDEDQKGQLIIEGLGEEVERVVLIVSALAPKTTEIANYQYSISYASHP